MVKNSFISVISQEEKEENITIVKENQKPKGLKEDKTQEIKKESKKKPFWKRWKENRKERKKEREKRKLEKELQKIIDKQDVNRMDFEVEF